MASRVVRTTVGDLIGGVSQQPDSVRLSNQCERQDDAYVSVVDGLGKRQPTEHIRNLTDQFINGALDLDGQRPFVHWINRDNEERYVVMVHKNLVNGISIFDLTTGEEMTTTARFNQPLSAVDGDAKDVKDYLGITNNPGDHFNDLRATTVADTTFLLNKTVKPRMDESVIADAVDVGVGVRDWKSKSQRRWFLFMRSVAGSSRYSVKVHTKTGPFHLRAKRNKWDPELGDDEYLAWVKTFDGNLEPGRHKQDYWQGNKHWPYDGWGGQDDTPPYDPAIGAFSGRMIGTFEAHEVLQQLWNARAEPPNRVPGYITRFNGGIQDHYRFKSKLGPDEVLQRLIKVNGPYPVAPPGLGTPLADPPRFGAVMKFELLNPLNNKPGIYRTYAPYREKMLIQVAEQGDGEDNLIAFSDEVARLSQLPLICEHGHRVKITGLDDNDSDEYYVQFVGKDLEPQPEPADNMGTGYWEETCASLSRPRILSTSMPFEIVRLPDNRVTTTNKFRFEVRPIEWGQKGAGDDESNPNPSFIGENINDVFLWRNRLGFLAGSRLIMSQADEYKNFWRTSVKQLLDSDPIDIDAGHSRVAKLRHAAALEENLFLFSDRTQFIVRADGILTPRTASVVPATEYDSIPDMRPLPTERGIYFGFQAGGRTYSRVHHLSRVQNSDSFDAFDTTGQVPRYLKGKIIGMTSTSTESVMAIHTDDADSQNTLYIYKWLDQGESRLLTAWFRYRLGSSANCQILGAEFYDDILYLLMKRTHGTTDTYHLEKIAFTGQRNLDVASDGSDSTFRCLLDRRVDETQCFVAVGPTGTNEVNIDLPYAAEEGADMRIVTRAVGGTGAPGEQIPYVQSLVSAASGQPATRLKVDDPDGAYGELVAAGALKFYVGATYKMEYEFSRPSLRNRTDRGVESVKSGRYQVLQGWLSLGDTGYGKLTVTPAVHSDGTKVVDRSDREYIHPIMRVGLGSSFLGNVNVRDSVIQFPVRAVPEEFRILLENDTPYPCNPKSLELEASYSARSTRYG